MIPRNHRPRSTLLRIVSRALRVFPVRFRDAHEQEILDHIRDADSRVRGRRRILFWFGTATDLARAWWRLCVFPSSRGRVARVSFSSPGLVHSLLQDVRFAARSLMRTPAWTAVVVFTLALSIGMNTAIFSVVHAVLMAPLEYESPEELLYLRVGYSQYDIEDGSFAGGDFHTIRRVSQTLADVAAITTIRQNLTGGERAEQVRVGWVSKNLFDLLGVNAVVGRTFARDDPMGTAILSYGLWRRAFSGDPDAIGRTVELDDYPYVIVGVLPPTFRAEFVTSSDIDIWKVPDDWWQNGDVWNGQGTDLALLRLIGRSAPGATVTAVRSELDAIATQIVEDRPDYAVAGLNYDAQPLHERIAGDVRPTLLVLAGAVGVVLLIACANVMNLLLVRAQSRRRELAVRAALGAGRRRIVRLLLVESLVLALAGAVGGIGLGFAATRGLPALRPPDLPRLANVTVNGPVLLFAVAIAVSCVLVFGLLPAVRTARRSAFDGMRHVGNDTKRSHQLNRTLVVTQISLSLVLLIGAGLLTASLSRLRSIEPGFDYDNLLTFSVSLPGKRYDWPAQTNRFLLDLEQRIEALRGVGSAGIVWPMPLLSTRWTGDVLGGAADPDLRTVADYRLATPDFFSTAGIRVVEGSVFGSEDGKAAVVVSRALAEHAWPGETAVGKRARANPWGGGVQMFEVIGVVDDVRYGNLREPASATIYFDAEGWSWADWEVNVLVRTAGEPTALIEPIRETLAQMDAQIPMAQVRPMTDLVRDHLAANRFALVLIGLFAGVAAVLAAVGLYGVLSYVVEQRMREIGIRIALGSGRRSILRLVLGDGVRMTLVGIAVGVAGSLVLTRFLATYLYGVSATDARTFVFVALGLAAVAVCACYLPARRATRLDPVRVLHAE